MIRAEIPTRNQLTILETFFSSFLVRMADGLPSVARPDTIRQCVSVYEFAEVFEQGIPSVHR